MNIFYIDESPFNAARLQIDAHVRKMPTECFQMMCSALLRHGAQSNNMPLTKSGTHAKGGYKHHPCTKWAGNNKENFKWLNKHAYALGVEFRRRFGKEHFCTQYCSKLAIMGSLFIPDGKFTEPPLCMPEEYQQNDTVESYRNYYFNAKKTNVKNDNMWIFTNAENAKEWWAIKGK